MQETCQAFGPGGGSGLVWRALSAGSVSRWLAVGGTREEQVVEKQWLSIGEAAAELGLAESTIVRGIDAGRIEAVQFGESHKATRIHRHALMPWTRSTHSVQLDDERRVQVMRLRVQRAAVEKAEAELERERRAWDSLFAEIESGMLAALPRTADVMERQTK